MGAGLPMPLRSAPAPTGIRATHRRVTHHQVTSQRDTIAINTPAMRPPDPQATCRAALLRTGIPGAARRTIIHGPTAAAATTRHPRAVTTTRRLQAAHIQVAPVGTSQLDSQAM